jgi:anti-sigma B factor antagonist
VVQVPGIKHPLLINGVPVVTAPAEIDATTAQQLRMVLYRAAAHRHTAIVVDMTGTRFCDSAGLTVLVRAHRRAVADDSDLRVVIRSGSAISRIFAITGLDRVIPVYGSLDEALPPRPAAGIRPSRPRLSARRQPARRPATPGRQA